MSLVHTTITTKSGNDSNVALVAQNMLAFACYRNRVSKGCYWLGYDTHISRLVNYVFSRKSRAHFNESREELRDEKGYYGNPRARDLLFCR